MTEYTIRPISDRTQFTGRHRESPFSATWPATERLLLAELTHLNAIDVMLEIDVTESDLKRDGGLRANARPTHPGVRIAFDSRDLYGPLAYATDRFWHWRDNARAIALGLEALRRVDRYGITRRGEQYAGWKQLPAGTGAPPSHMTRDEAESILVGYRPTGGDWRDALRAARRATHPDMTGNRELWDLVETAARTLGITP